MLYHRLRRWLNIKPALGRALGSVDDHFITVDLSHIGHTLTNAGLMLDQRLRHWPSIKPALGRAIGSVDDHFIPVDLSHVRAGGGGWPDPERGCAATVKYVQI